jgi:cytochrome c oxidase subunit 2
MGLAIYALAFPSREHEPQKTRLFIIGGGAVFPVVVLGVLLVFGLRLMPDLLDHGNEDGIGIRVSGEQWWWRVRYEAPDGSHFELANELRLPKGRRTPLWLTSPDVIHSFWVPSLGGKMDMLPGRVNRFALEPTRTGIFRGLCAEYCGASHAKMMFHVAVLEPKAFEAWVEAQKLPAAAPTAKLSRRGAEVFAEHGCGACHSVRGTDAAGVVGPDLTHVGSRIAVGAGILDNSVQGFAAFLRQTKQLKPGVHMPTFDMLSQADAQALASYLDGLR